MDHYGYGDFNHRTVVSGFVNDLSTMQPGAVHFGLEQQIEYVYGFFAGEDGTITCLEQKFVGSVSTGTFVMRTDLPYLLELDGDHFLWDQGELCRLEGDIKTLGVQFYAASADEPLFFTSIPYWVEGTVLGRPTSGLVYFDRVHLKPGREWKETKMFTDIQLSWNIFGNVYSDGSIEYGKIVVGKDGFNAARVVDDHRLTAGSSQVSGRYVLNEGGFIRHAQYAVDGHVYEFRGEDTGNMAEFSASRWNGYHAQFGITRRLGDDRELVSGVTWLESFDHRIRDAGLALDSLD
jgi:hypothetical protein